MGLSHIVPIENKAVHECDYPNGSRQRPYIIVGLGSLWECGGCGKEYMYFSPATWLPTVTIIEKELE
jgi:hypothetical protein